MRWVVPIALTTACGFQPLAAPGTSGRDGGTDATDARVAPSEAMVPCYGTGLGVQACLTTAPITAITVASIKTIDTSLGSNDCAALSGSMANEICVVAGTSITIDGFLTASGPRPLVLVSLSTMDINGTIDVASHSNGSPQLVGPGGDSSLCGGTAAAASRSAGFGGSFGTQGGNGGSNAPPDGKAGPVIVPTSLRGGCAGGIGLDATATGIGGHGGGAVDLIAVTAITMFGVIDASGSSGGGAGPTNNGGGGGGSGGLVVFDAPSVSFTSTTLIYANGGGGGGGTGTNMNNNASGGGDPSNANSGGGGGAGINGGGDGGDGARASSTAIDGADGNNGNGNGNGGGGGGLGVVRVFQQFPIPASGHESPPAT